MLGVGHGHVQNRAHDSHGFRGTGQPFHVDNCLDGVPGSVDRADYAFRFQADVAEADFILFVFGDGF